MHNVVNFLYQDWKTEACCSNISFSFSSVSLSIVLLVDRASDDGGDGGAMAPPLFAKKMQFRNLLIIALILFQTLCSFKFKQIS